MSGAPSSYLLERAWVGGAVRDDVLVEIADGRFSRVVLAVGSQDHGDTPSASGVSPLSWLPTAKTATRVAGLTIPGLRNDHSHAFHRALRGRTQRERGTFWTWREQMYAVAQRLSPESYFALARATYREMVAAGYTSVTEFHYLHHQPDGTPYADPNAMGEALTTAAVEAGIRITLLDTCYLSSGFGRPVETAQLRYSDGSTAAWDVRTAQLRGSGAARPDAARPDAARPDAARPDAARHGAARPDAARHGAAIHSVRAVPREAFATFRGRAPLHIHLSEQVAENEACVAAYGLTPTRLLHDEGLLGPGTTVVHATHLTDDDIALLGGTGTNVCITPTTERDLADGIGPAKALAEAGCAITIGSDSHAVIDPFEELRGLEMDERLATQQRGHWSAAELLDMGTAGRIAVGEPADLVTIDTTSPRTAGTGADEHTAVYAATAADVIHVVVGGAPAYTPGDDGTIACQLDRAIGALWPPR